MVKQESPKDTFKFIRREDLESEMNPKQTKIHSLFEEIESDNLDEGTDCDYRFIDVDWEAFKKKIGSLFIKQEAGYWGLYKDAKGWQSASYELKDIINNIGKKEEEFISKLAEQSQEIEDNRHNISELQKKLNASKRRQKEWHTALRIRKAGMRDFDTLIKWLKKNKRVTEKEIKQFLKRRKEQKEGLEQ